MASIVGHCEHHIKNSEMFIEKLKEIRVGPNDILISLDVVSLFTKVPVEDTLKLLADHFPPETIKLFRLVMTTTYFLYGGKFYEMTDGMAMGSPLSPAMANFFMEHFEERALNSAPLRPSVFFRYVDDIFMVWPHGVEALGNFVEHMNNIHSNIQFTIETEEEGRLPFLDVLIQRKSDGRLGHSVYRKPTHTDLYLSAQSFHHPLQKRAVLNTLIFRAKTVSDEDHLESEIHHLKYVFRKNGYGPRDIRTAFAKKKKKNENVEDSRDGQPTAFLPFCGATSNKIGRVLGRHGIRSIFRPPRKIKEMLRPVKDSLGLRTPGIYNIPCECGSNYIGQSIRTVADRCTEHQRHIRNRELEKSAVAEHSLTKKHKILFDETTILSQACTYWDSVIKEAVEIRMCEDSFNRDSGYNLSGAWKRALDTEKRQRHSVQRLDTTRAVAPPAQT